MNDDYVALMAMPTYVITATRTAKKAPNSGSMRTAGHFTKRRTSGTSKSRLHLTSSRVPTIVKLALSSQGLSVTAGSKSR